MSKAYQCDRCMQFFKVNKEFPTGSTTSVLSGFQYILYDSASGERRCGKAYELCDDCIKKMKDFVEIRETNT